VRSHVKFRELRGEATPETDSSAVIRQRVIAVTAVRNLAGRPPASWTNTVAPGVQIKKEDITDLRIALDDGLTALGIPTSAYDDQTLTSGGTLIKKVHIAQLRQRATTGTGGSGGGGGTTVDLRWLISDHLGTPRIILDKTGNLNGVTRHDYLPFGEELAPPTGGRTTTQGYQSTDGVRQKLTSKERDPEARLDYFGARYYASNQGRFIGVDPENADGKVESPQSWEWLFVQPQ
jgi:RHS repeat-associated protein